MATAEQLKVLIRSHFDGDQDRFTTIALQVAAHEARQGHTDVANDIRQLVDQAKSSARILPIHKELDDLILASDPALRLCDLVVPTGQRKRLERVLREYRQQERLRAHGMTCRRKLLFTGPPGTGKTMSATVLAGELHLPLFTVLMDRIVTKFMGETSAKLRQVFHVIGEVRGVYLFDEFDAIGAERALDNDVGEMRRVLNSFLQFIERDRSDSLVIAATNNLRLLDQALFRRFDDVLHYGLPSDEEAKHLITNRLGKFRPKTLPLAAIAKDAETLSHAEIAQACDDAIKEAILADKSSVSAALLRGMLADRRSAYGKVRGKG